ILKEVNKLVEQKDFKGYISDIGGPTGNMYKISCKVFGKTGSCKNRRCLYPEVCQNIVFSHDKQIDLLTDAAKNNKIKKIFVSSGMRHDLIIADNQNGEKYLKYISENNISGQLKIAPEHTSDNVLDMMGKPRQNTFLDFMNDFEYINKPLNQFLTCYFMVDHPGCSLEDTKELLSFIKNNLQFTPEQVQVFTPTPSTFSTLFYYTEQDVNGNDIFVEKDRNARMKQKLTITQGANKNVSSGHKHFGKKGREFRQRHFRKTPLRGTFQKVQ
ncbi:MAG: YgiQ family radical SAM protein, partial [Elusimicrobia bacterium]|nr:YgiQ family radical SAM protein [Elusimicrobiota bacterium]